MKNQKGITLVALILIMVALLIIAGISISLVLTDNSSTVQDNNYEDFSEEDDVLYDINGNLIDDSDENVIENDSSMLNNTLDSENTTNTVSNEITNEVSNVANNIGL